MTNLPFFLVANPCLESPIEIVMDELNVPQKDVISASPLSLRQEEHFQEMKTPTRNKDADNVEKKDTNQGQKRRILGKKKMLM